MAKEERDYEDSVSVCAHRVSFWFNGNAEITEELKMELAREAEERAKSQITEGYTSGELNYETDTVNFRGWWSIQK